MAGSLWFNTRPQWDEVQSGTRLRRLICGSRDELRWHLRRPGGQVDQRRCMCPLQCLLDRTDVCITTVQAAQVATPPFHLRAPLNPLQPPPPSHTNGVFAWLVNRADCSHLTAFRFKYLSVSRWAKSALTVRLLFKVADRRLGERHRASERGRGDGEERERKKSVHPSLVK